ncbi:MULTISPECIES: CHAP domain-containing protein [unclassified Streptococcus]|uniref:CHAP domain-containing protein n=1 Tax=unclassified Streptococcus TaxID=2608887 RepID=UPI0010727528|nr:MULTISPECIES: CHAP domain-containing protein [unclassified Streptococcus]MBF0786595.1 CHAP domain-containing protein [Streptococcus sp. 19428wC2_LYSM12]MCQ9210912.1 CHAP domain-containing protein [Streptococcus sp. B01]MCQ9214181.1 CHAP domain-containing protein [Streptococcus sp. O1]TFV06557.1 CHAP domain-containing protein [Streptococcus sp. LYSM12]
MTENVFIPRTTISDLDNSAWTAYAVARTGISLPNCFTYATARISEIIGYNQPLDGEHRVNGAGELWEIHNRAFTQSSKPVLGALAIYKDSSFGHVAVVEKIEGNDIWISQSNYGEYTDVDGDGLFDGFSFVKTSGIQNSYTNNGAQLAGFLIHKDLRQSKMNNKTEEDDMSIAFIRIEEDFTKKIKKGNIYLINAGARTYKHLNGNQYNAAKTAFPKAVTLSATKAANYFNLVIESIGATEI